MSSGQPASDRVAVLVESEFIPSELADYEKAFAEAGMQVEFISRLWGQPSQRFLSDVTEPDTPPEVIEVDVDFEDRRPSDYAAVIMAANYTAVRLRYFERPPTGPVTREHVQSPPAVQFFAEAMRTPDVVKGALCHGLWILTPFPELLKGRRVICHEVVLADVLNAGAEYVPPDDANAGVVVDGDLITGRSKDEATGLARAVIDSVQRMRREREDQ